MDQALLSMGSASLRKAAMSFEAKNYVLSNPIIFQTLKKAAERYIGGETLEETILKVKSQNSMGFKCSMEFMGENTLTAEEAISAKNEFTRICSEIKNQRLSSTVSLDLSHIGLKVSKQLCLENLNIICQEAGKDTEVMISAEGVDVTDSVLEIYKIAAGNNPNLGITLQAYLHRSKNDFKDLINTKGRIRIVKGAFETPDEVSIPRGDKLNEVYLDYIEQLLSVNHKCSIATHDEKVQQEAKRLINKYESPIHIYEFESLFGIRNENLARIRDEGYQTKVYFVYGKEWYLYLCNRIAEYPLSIFQALNDIVN